MIQVGQGFDLHRLETGRPFLLGGIRLDWPKGPHGHSDGDVLLHAIIDALLGAAGLGDIGDWFPATDASLKGVDSTTLLKTVLDRLKTDGWELLNIDTTILLEAPKLMPYKATLRNRLAELTGLPAPQINIKAKTMEGLGAIGHEEAVAAMASVLIQKSS